MKWLLLMACAVLLGCAAKVETPEDRYHREVTSSIVFEPQEVENDVTITLPNGPKDGDLFRYRKAGDNGWYERVTNMVEVVTVPSSTVAGTNEVWVTTKAKPSEFIPFVGYNTNKNQFVSDKTETGVFEDLQVVRYKLWTNYADPILTDAGLVRPVKERITAIGYYDSTNRFHIIHLFGSDGYPESEKKVNGESK